MPSPVGTWGASPAEPTYFIPVEFMPQPIPVRGTIRYRIKVSVGGTEVRVRLSNEAGAVPLSVGTAVIGLARRDAPAVEPGTGRGITFGGHSSVVIPPCTAVVSDPVDMSLPDRGEVIVSLYLPETHVPAQGGDTHKAEICAGSDTSWNESWEAGNAINVRPIVSALSVVPLRPTRAIVTLGDSITDGSTAHTGCHPFAFRGWPDILAERLIARQQQDTRTAEPGATACGVVNAGIGGNRLLDDFIGPRALARLDRDVFAVPGISHLIVSEGINDIGIGGRTIKNVTLPMTTAPELISAYRQIIARCHERGIKAVGATLPPFRDAFYFLEEKELVRQEANRWIRQSGEFDGVIDFDRVLHIPADAGRLRPEYDTGDHLHPNAAAFVAMGNAIDLGLF